MKPKKSVQTKKKEKRQDNPKETFKRKKYQAENVVKALEAIQKGMSKKLAAKTYQVPRTTLIYRLQNPDHNARPGPATLLTEAEENDLEEWLNNCAKKGFPKRKDDVINSVSFYLKKKKRLGKFTNGEKWLKLFLRRHPNLRFRTPEAVTAASAAVSEKDVRGWFKQIEAYLQENDLFHILHDPSRVFNGDETNFLLCPKTGVVIAPKGHKNVYEVDSAPAKTSLTVLFTFCADGQLTPPMVIFPNKRLSSDISSKVPSDWGIGLSDNGWMKAEVFHDYIQGVLYPHLIKSGTQFPVILFVDGHKTHLTYAVSDLCTKLKIVLIALYPNCTRLLQPADVSAFKPLKYGWQKSVLEWRRNNASEALTKINFVPLLQTTIKKWVKPATIINGFRATGLCPWDANAVDFTKCLGKSTDCIKPNQQCKTNEKVLTQEEFIRLIGKNKVEELEKKTVSSEDYYLRRIWDYFKEDQTFFSDNVTSNIIHDKENETTVNTIPIEEMRVIISDDVHLDETIPDSFAVSPNVIDLNFLCNDNHSTNVHDKEWSTQDTQVITITHNEVISQSASNKSSHDKTPCKPIHIKLSDCTPVKLQDILVLPKTPQRKGMKDIKRAPFVLTSAEWKAQENEKNKIKEEKAEGIKKRKEEREKKKEQEKLKKEQIKIKKQNTKKKNTDTKGNEVRALVLSDEFRIDTVKKSPQIQGEKENSIQSCTEEIEYPTTSKNTKVLYTDEEIERLLTDC